MKQPRCRECAKPMLRRRGESLEKFAGREYCSVPCYNRAKTAAAEARKAAFQHPPCSVCSAAVPPREDEDFHAYCSRETCSPECAIALRALRALRAGAGQHPKPNKLDPVDFGGPDAFASPDPGDGGWMRLSRPATHVATASPIAGMG